MTEISRLEEDCAIELYEMVGKHQSDQQLTIHYLLEGVIFAALRA